MDEGGFDFNIVIVGLGLIGGSYAKALRISSNAKVYGIDIDEEVLKKAEEMGIIDKGYKNGNDVLEKADIVIIALYPYDTIDFVKSNAHNFKRGAVITDASGVKEILVKKINSCLPDDVEFIASHPMAGKESFGFDISSEGIFKDANFIITPNSRNSKNSIMIIEKMARTIGCRNVVCVNPEDHDRIISYTSDLPHAVAVALMKSHMSDESTVLFTGGSFKDMTRVADINSKLWSQLFILNSDNLVHEIEKFQKVLDSIKEAVKSHNEDVLIDIFINSLQRRKEMMTDEKP